MRAASWVVAVLAFVASGASGKAYADEDREAQREREELAELDRRLPPIKADPGREQAPVRSPPWCSAITEAGGWSPTSIARTLEAAPKEGWGQYFHAAPAICKYAKEPAGQKAAAVVEQAWINLTGLSDAEAVESFTARLKKDDFVAAKAKLCEQLAVSDEIEGEEKAFMGARRALFGCSQGSMSEAISMWGDSAFHVPDDLLNYMDASSTGVDEAVRLALINDHVRFVWGDRGLSFNHAILTYVLDQYDYKAFDATAARKLLETEPYKGNVYARVVMLESIGVAKRGIADLDVEIQKKSKDADWKELLVTAPQRGIADYVKEAARWKGELERSNAFELKFWGPSKRAIKGCLPTLRKDFVAVAKTLKHANAVELKESLSDPVASLLFSRVAACAAADDNTSWADKLNREAGDLRASRGPRLAAYWASVDALSKILADRTKFPVAVQDFWFFKNSALSTRTLDLVTKGSTTQFIGLSGKGIIKSVKKTPKGVEIAFQTEQHTEIGRSCTETNHILSFRADGSPLYYQKCHDTGPITVNDTADPVTIPTEWAEGIAVGAAIEFEAERGKPPGRLAMVKAIYSDKSKKKLVSFFGLGL